ncbi:MAG TPA: DNA-binding domain-containing protein [Terriglobia bacterium]|nr:DNA-binding domain-containing protein [Terriglobia bacterium]
MPALHDIQALIRRSVVTGDLTGVTGLLDVRTERRIAVHRRNYQSSLVDALLSKFPAVAWLAGMKFVATAAEEFIEECPPQKPCIAEYGETFPGFLSRRPGAGRIPYLETFAELEWDVGHVTIAIPEPHITIEDIASIKPGMLPELRLGLQHGVKYLLSGWPIEELMKLYVTDCAPDRLEFDPCDVFLEVRGSHGSFQILRLQKAEFRFRESLAKGMRIGDAVEQAMDIDPSFDGGASFVRLITEDLVTCVTPSSEQGDIL